MSIDFVTAAPSSEARGTRDQALVDGAGTVASSRPVLVAHPSPARGLSRSQAAAAEPRAAGRGSADAPALTDAAGARAARARLERAITGVDLMIAILAGAAGVLFGLFAGEAAAVVLLTTVATVAVWFHLLTRNSPLEVPVLGMGGTEVRRVCRTLRTVFGPLLVVELLFPALLPLALLTVVAPALLVGTVLSRLWWRRSLRSAERASVATATLVVGGRAAAAATSRSLLAASGSHVVGVCLPAADAEMADAIEAGGRHVPVIGTDRAVLQAVRDSGAGVVVLTATDAVGPEDIRDLAWQLAALDVELVITAGLADVADHRLVQHQVAGTPMVHVAYACPGRSFGPAKRMLDLAVALIGLAAVSPLMALIAIAIRIDSRGPIFYRAERIGADGRPFRMIKFRSMYVDADARRTRLEDDNMGAGPLFKIKDDPRVTAVGRFIRRYSLDELPQFFNVVRGEMSVVGPRPALAHEVEQYPAVMRRRLLVKPGVTGAWQVSGRSDLSWDESIRIDVGYVENWSLGTDIGIIARTFRTVLTSDGAY